MDECSACHVGYFHSPDVRMFSSAACDHRVCEPCITRLFRHGRAHPCPACGQPVRAEDFSERPRGAGQVEPGVAVRRQICAIFCKTAEDFATEELYNEYVAQREDTIYGLVNPSSQEQVQETWRYIDQYRERTAEKISRAQGLRQRRAFQEILSIIEEEGVFRSRASAGWGEHLCPGAASRPFQTESRAPPPSPPADVRDGGRDTETSPFAPPPLLGGYGTADSARQMSGGGQPPDTCRNKARQFFFTDLAAAAGAVGKVA